MFLRLYLVIYFVLVAGALAALWQAGALSRLPGSWVVLSVLAAAGLGALLALVSRRRKGPDVPA